MKKLALDATAWAMNVVSAVCIIIVNKQLMGKANLGFTFAVTLSAAHILLSALTVQIPAFFRGRSRSPLVPRREVIANVIVGNLSIVSINLSLMINPVGFYQIAKVMNIPFVFTVECLWLGRTLTKPTLVSVIMVIIGVTAVTVSEFDVSITALGCAMAALAVVSNGLQQIMCRLILKKNNLSASELLLIVGLPQGSSLLLVAPFLDRWLSQKWVTHFDYTPTVIQFLILSCTIAIFVKYSQVMVLGRFSALTYQVMGHAKTFLVITGGIVIFGDEITARDASGMLVAIAGMIGYGYYSSPTSKQPPKPVVDAEIPLVNPSGNQSASKA